MRDNLGRWAAVWAVAASLVAGQALAATTAGKNELLPLGAQAPDFKLTDVVSGQTVSRDDFADKQALVVMFICRHCPYVQRVKAGLAQFGKAYAGKHVGIVAISANDPANIPQDAPESLKEMAQQEGFTFPFLFDETQAVAAAYTALCTPDLFVFDRSRKLVYRGQFDDARPGNSVAVTGKDLRAAVDAVLAGKPVSADQPPSVGCGIKWQAGREPAYTAQ